MLKKIIELNKFFLHIIRRSKYIYSKIYKSKLNFKFNNYQKIKRNYSQAFQDIFVLSATNGKKNGTYLEIGGFDGKLLSNTYLLEKEYNWNGVAIEHIKQRTDKYNNLRKNICITADALEVDYSSLLKNNMFPKNIDYLQIDIDPFENSKKCLYKIPFDEYIFSTITFETDRYRNSDNIDSIEKTREYLASKDYILALKDISTYGNKFEDWYIHKSLITMDWKLPEKKLNDAFDLFISDTNRIYNLMNLIYLTVITKILR